MEERFVCGYYSVRWYSESNEIVKDTIMYLTMVLYRREIMNMQTAFLQGQNVVRMVVMPIEK